MISPQQQFSVIKGGRTEQERKKALLFATPEIFETAEFEKLCEECGLALADVEPLIARRIRHRATDALERDALLAIIEGDNAMADRLLGSIERRNELGLRVIS